MKAPYPVTPDLTSYDTIIIARSGGKDSVAALCMLLEASVDPARIELWHHDVDGRGDPFMDWPSSLPFVRALGEAYGIPVYCSWRSGGFEKEMLRDETPTGPIWYETPSGMDAAGGRGPVGTRLRYPQVSADLSVRWCSSALRISVMDAAIRGQSAVAALLGRHVVEGRTEQP